MPQFGSDLTSKVFASSSIHEDDILRQLEVIKKRTKSHRMEAAELSSDDEEYQVSDFVRGEWSSLAKYAGKINPAGRTLKGLN